MAGLPKYHWLAIGALPEEVFPLLRAAHMAQLPVVGVAFHLDSAAMHPEAYRIAIATSKMVFNTTVYLGMPEMYMLNVDGDVLQAHNLVIMQTQSTLLCHSTLRWVLTQLLSDPNLTVLTLQLSGPTLSIPTEGDQNGYGLLLEVPV
ncbi:hypothetical protein FRX31_023529 [Thalictrum thalictroides]|uniref:Orn/DAP/Arg decarboxylase 2 N-terminal domain-containing protein n=1 Tax=Thalictrum thalictroides TaxID=46969 RepID=A0A7J6VP43_THATH|nr:hypothetical protein FRX31_023529 [Thalictrum thalictroides]